MIKGGAHPDSERGAGGRDAEGNQVGEGIEFLAHQGGFSSPACDFAVHEVEE